MRTMTWRLLVLWWVATLAAAQESRPAWSRLGLDLPEGIEVTAGVLPGPVRAFVAAVELGRKEHDVRPMHSATPAGKEPLSKLAARLEAVVAINASFFNVDQKPCPVLGWLVIDGDERFAPQSWLARKPAAVEVSRAAIWWSGGARPEIGWISRRGAATFACPDPLPGTSTESRPEAPRGAREIRRVRGAIGAGPMLIVHGQTRITRREEHMFEKEDVRHPRTAVGLTARNRLLMVVVDGRYDGSRGVTLAELAELMASLGATEAMNFDGGGSSTLVVQGKVINNPVGKGVERPVPTGLGVFRVPEGGGRK